MERPYGSWPSVFSAAMVAQSGVRLGAVSVDGGDIYWLEGRPSEAGRTVLVRRTADGSISEITPPPFNVRTRVHEYGGGAYVVADGVAYFSNFSDQRIYRAGAGELSPAHPLTPEGRWHFADATVDRRRRRLICVREDHTAAGREPENALVAIPLDATDPSPGEVLTSGYDFYSTPRLSADSRRLTWICWRHPHMPWDETELWVADVTEGGALDGAHRVAGGAGESIYQPGWLPDNAVCFASDRDGWWRLYTWSPGGVVSPVLTTAPARTEFGRPEWVFGTATWACTSAGRLVTACTDGGRWYLGIIDRHAGVLEALTDAPACNVPFSLHAAQPEPLDWLAATATHAVLVASWPDQPEAVVRIALATGRVEKLRELPWPPVCQAYVSTPEAIAFPTADGQVAHAFVYLPVNPVAAAPAAERPPLIVIGHGGPTTATRVALDLKVQFWTSRGFAVADVNYRGSSGYGREYRRLLKGQWGIADVADMIHVARFLAAEGTVDARRLIIRGGSAGGYTALAALAFHPGEFQAGASYYGISDLEVLAHDTHKFESRYLDGLVAPYPEGRDIYRARSPIHFVDRLACALILFQGLEDRVVPPNQSAVMAEAVKRKGLPVAYLTFPGEQHGFRQADTIIRCLEAELAFYGAVFGFDVPADIARPAIDNLPS